MNPLLIKFNRILALWFGCGLSPKAPGTIGTLGAIPLFYLLATKLDPLHYLYAAGAFALITIVVAQIFETQAEHDSQEFVMDEVAGFLVTMAWVPATPLGILAGFVAFRFFDIVKPFPIGYIDRKIEGGTGTVADDLVAGIFANIVLQLMLQNGVPL